MDEVDQIGTAEDDLRRADARQDSLARQKKVEAARRGIYQKGWAVTSNKVKDRVGKFSGVAIEVC